MACLTGNNSSPVTLNTSTPQASDACFTGTAPLTLSSSSIVGGNSVTLTATLTQSHSPYGIVNLNGLNNLVAPPCDVPVFLQANVNSISLTQPTAVVTSTTQAPLWTLISFTDASSGRNRNLISVATPLTLQPGGSVVVPPLASFSVTDPSGAPISTSDPTATVSSRVSEGNLSGAQIATFPGCTGSPACTGPATVAVGASSASVRLSTSAVSAQDQLTVSASAPWSNSSASANLTINPGACTPATCSSLGFNCGSASNGCGGTLNCGTCASGQTCTNNVCTSSCTPNTCAGLGFKCGSAADGCGGLLNCGTCASGQTCTSNVCTSSCTPNTCAGLGFNCGTASDGCGGTLSCGSCGRRKTCVNNVCQ